MTGSRRCTESKIDCSGPKPNAADPDGEIGRAWREAEHQAQPPDRERRRGDGDDRVQLST